MTGTEIQGCLILKGSKNCMNTDVKLTLMVYVKLTLAP